MESPPLDIQAESQLVTFLLGDEEFGFDIMNVQEIIRVPKLARVPKTADYVEGIANLRGAVLPIIDTRKRFGLEKTEETDRTRVLVIDNNGVRTGLRVDRVKQVTRVSNGNVEAPPSIIKGISADYLSGVVKLDQGKRIVMALNPAKVCQVGLSQAGVSREHDDAKRAFTASQQSVQHNDDVEQMVTFKLAREEFAFRIERVREILRVEEPKEVPDTPDYVLGVLTVRGKILPIIDLRSLLRQESLADELCAGVERQGGAYRRGVETLKTVAAVDAQALPDTAFLESAKQWLNQFSSSSEALMESVGKLRNFNDGALRLSQAALKLWGEDPAGARQVMSQEIIPVALQAADGMDGLAAQIQKNIKEDQRIIVVDAGGMLLGLVVDHVNEVLNVAKNLIEPPPSMSGSANVELSGIAKLNDGARLIMLLDSSKLLADQTMQSLQQNADGAQLADSANKPDMNQGTKSNDAHLAREQQMVTFRLGDEEFGIPISQIQEIDRYAQITRVPRAPEFVDGVTNLRGEIIPVIDTRKRFGLPVKAADDRTRIIIVDLAGTKTGLLVDSVSQVLNIALKDISPPPAAIESGIDNEFISGIGKVDQGKRMVVLLNVEKILTHREKEQLAQAVVK